MTMKDWINATDDLLKFRRKEVLNNGGSISHKEASKCMINQDGSLTIPKEFVDRWTRQINTNYIDLTENEKDSDRKEAIRIMECIKDKVKYNK